MKDVMIGRRGRMALLVKSVGPGTMTKCVLLAIVGLDAMRSAKSSNPSAMGSV